MIRFVLKLSAAIIVLCFVVGLVQTSRASAQQSDEEVVVLDGGNQYGGSTEAGVNLTGIGGLVRLAGGGGGSGGGPSNCSWGLINPNNGTGEFGSGYALALERQSRPLDDFLLHNQIGVRALEFAELSAASDRSQIRYAYSYGSDCASLVAAWVTLADVIALANQAFEDMKRTWPEQEIVLAWPEPVEDTWTALHTSLPWVPISASASEGGLTVTVTARPVRAVWDVADVNTRYGGQTEVLCDGPGDIPALQANASCKVWFAGPSTGLADANGLADTTTLNLTVVWVVGYSSTFGSDPNWLVWPTTSGLDGVRVLTTQSVNITGGA